MIRLYLLSPASVNFQVSTPQHQWHRHQPDTSAAPPPWPTPTQHQTFPISPPSAAATGHVQSAGISPARGPDSQWPISGLSEDRWAGWAGGRPVASGAGRDPVTPEGCGERVGTVASPPAHDGGQLNEVPAGAKRQHRYKTAAKQDWFIAGTGETLSECQSKYRLTVTVKYHNIWKISIKFFILFICLAFCYGGYTYLFRNTVCSEMMRDGGSSVWGSLL